MAKVEKKVYISSNLETQIKQSKILNKLSFSKLCNIGLEYILPKLNIEIDTNDNNFKKTYKRELILKKRREDMSKAYFFKRFLMRLRKMLEDNIQKSHLLPVIYDYYLESKTYNNNLDVTATILKYYYAMEKSESLERFKNYLNIHIIETDKLNDEVVKYGHKGNKRKVL